MRKTLLLTALTAILCQNTPSKAHDWPQFRGPQRDGKSTETDLLQKWPDSGPKMIFSAQGNGTGYASASIADGSVYTTGLIDKTGHLFAYDTKGNLRYNIPYGPEWTRSYKGTRATPLIDADRIYIYSGLGVLSCHQAQTGKQIWAVDTLKEFEGENIRWGMVCSPLIDGDNIYLTPGGKKGLMVALNKHTGKTIWATIGYDERAAYSSPMLIKCLHNDVLVTMIQKSVIGVNAETGKLHFSVPYPGSYDTSAIMPVIDGRKFFVANIIEKEFVLGGTQYQLLPNGVGIFEATWNQTTIDTHHGGVILVDRHLYASTFDSTSKGKWACVDWETGKLIYEHNWNDNKGSLTYADGMLYCYDENDGNLALVKATPEKFDIVSSFKIQQGSGKHWAHPSIANGVLYIRHGESLMAFDIKQK